MLCLLLFTAVTVANNAEDFDMQLSDCKQALWKALTVALCFSAAAVDKTDSACAHDLLPSHPGITLSMGHNNESNKWENFC